jgi:hypothetical protein
LQHTLTLDGNDRDIKSYQRTILQRSQITISNSITLDMEAVHKIS